MKKMFLVVMMSISLFAMGGPSLVETITIKKGEVNPLQEFTGSLKFDKNSVLAAQNAGVVQKINFEVGDKVKKGQTLLKIDADILDAQILAAKASYQSSKKDFERYATLLKSKSISQKQFDDINLAYITAKSHLKELEVQKTKKSIKAPFDGVIVDKKIEIGEWVSAGTAVATMVNVEEAQFLFNVPLNIVNGLKKGDVYDINVDNTILKGTLYAAIPSGDTLTRTFPVKFKAKTNGAFLFSGQQAKVSLSQNAKKTALIVSRDAVIKRFGKDIVFIIDDKNMAQMIPVKITGYLGKQIAIEGAGLKDGMSVVSKGNERIFPNSPVKVINK